MSYYVYALYSHQHNKIYIGQTSDLKDRLKSHFYNATKGYTTRFRPWRLAYAEKCETRKQAICREKQLKSYQGRLFIRNRIEQKFL